MLTILFAIIKSFFNKKQAVTKEKPMIDWNDPKSKISKYFTVHEATYLPSWACYHIPSKEEQEEIVKLAKIMDIIRERVGKAILVHVWMRPKKANCPGHPMDGADYNFFIGSKSTKSGHIFGKAVDFHFSKYKSADGCAEKRKEIEPWLEELDIRMEDISGAWLHIDTIPVGYKRFFKP